MKSILSVSSCGFVDEVFIHLAHGHGVQEGHSQTFISDVFGHHLDDRLGLRKDLARRLGVARLRAQATERGVDFPCGRRRWVFSQEIERGHPMNCIHQELMRKHPPHVRHLKPSVIVSLTTPRPWRSHQGLEPK
jgi:hypothetical protein